MRVVSGVQPSGVIHLGNYFGAIRDHVRWQEEAECFCLIADLHSLTVPRPAKELREHTLALAATYLACGLDPQRATLYRQSDVPEICELAWALGCVTPTGILDRAVAFKEARQRGEGTTAGLFSYPVLMASDILVLSADIVPVGRDQLQHLEITRDIAQRFNSTFGDGSGPLKLPEARLSSHPFVPGVDGEKMSKRYQNTISVLDEGSDLARKVRSIVTDQRKRTEPKNPDTCTVFALLTLVLKSEEAESVADRYRAGTIDYSEAKELLTERLDRHFEPIRRSYQQLRGQAGRVEVILEEGAAKVRAVAKPLLAEVRCRIGLNP